MTVHTITGEPLVPPTPIASARTFSNQQIYLDVLKRTQAGHLDFGYLTRGGCAMSALYGPSPEGLVLPVQEAAALTARLNGAIESTVVAWLTEIGIDCPGL